MPSRSSRKIYDSFDITRSQSSADIGSRPRASDKYTSLLSASPSNDDMTRSAYEPNRRSSYVSKLDRSFNESAIDLSTSKGYSATPEPEPQTNGIAASEKFESEDVVENEEEEKQQLSLKSHIEGQVAAPGSSVVFKASVSGSVDEYVWTKNGQELTSSDNVEINGDRLELSNLEASDSGIIGFEAKQGGESVSSVATLVVADSDAQPKVINLPQSVTATEGESAKFELELENVEGYAVQWFKGAEKVEKSDRVKSVKSGNTFKLDFKSVDKDDAAIYVVKVIKDKKAVAKYVAALHIE
uniref:Ig-like domain-containing protein n=1 Tax=Panagrolaimus davidi TaxID=227884 RepID=A0A914Q4T3_9BILA